MHKLMAQPVERPPVTDCGTSYVDHCGLILTKLLKFFFIGPHKYFSWIQYGFLSNFLTKIKTILKGFCRVKER